MSYFTFLKEKKNDKLFSNSEQKKNIIEEMKDDMRKESENLIVGEIGLIGKYILRSYIFFFVKIKKE